MSRLLRVVRRRRRDERGVIAIFTVMCMGGFLFASAAVAVDVSRWWLEAQRVQKAADAGALGAVSYMPQDLPSATTTAKQITARNGYDPSADSTVSVAVAQGNKSSQLKVTVCSTVTNTFGGMFGVPKTDVCRFAIADYTGPAPMGSPCNTFGNEPPAGSGSSTTATPTGTARGSSPSTNCPQAPQFWAALEGPNTDKAQGDRFGNTGCATGVAVDGCTAGTSNNNSEYDQGGYFWLIRVQPAAVGSTVDLQLYDPAFARQGTKCADLTTWATDTPNTYVGDAKTRYSPLSFSANPASMCAGDYFPGSNPQVQMTTSFALRQQTDSGNPRKAPVQNSTSSSPCIKQYTGQTSAPTTGDLTSTSGTYDQQLASVFHNWTSMCKFTPTRAGDYYLQVRTNVSASGSSPSQTNGQPNIIFDGNTNVLADNGNITTGVGVNSFGIRAVTPAGMEKSVSVSGYDRMPIFANADSASSTFNLIRVLPGAAGKSIAFSYFDVGDGSGSLVTGSVTVQRPTDATGSVTTTPFPRGGCKATGGYAGTGMASLTNCSAPFTGGSGGSNNGHTETIFIPIPDDYTCSFNDPAGCWYQVKVQFSAGSTVTDVTTWTANITGNPIRLIE